MQAIGNFQLRAGQPGSPAYLIVTGLPSDDELPPTPEGERVKCSELKQDAKHRRTLTNSIVAVPEQVNRHAPLSS